MRMCSLATPVFEDRQGDWIGCLLGSTEACATGAGGLSTGFLTMMVTASDISAIAPLLSPVLLTEGSAGSTLGSYVK